MQAGCGSSDARVDVMPYFVSEKLAAYIPVQVTNNAGWAE
jgi:hypothetical protein